MTATAPIDQVSEDVRKPAEVPAGVPFPQYSVGLLQCESEMLQAPEYDLTSFLDGDPRWHVELYTERSVTALLESADRFDCIVIGYNAVHKSGAIREALHAHPPNVGLCLLHQYSADAVRCLTGEVGLRFTDLTRTGEPVVTAANLDEEDEILLNWPTHVGLTAPVGRGNGRGPGGRGKGLPHSTAYVGLWPVAGSQWRTVLEVEGTRHRRPALVRTETRRWPPVVVSTALLAPRHDEHAALLGNMLLWCVSGRPSVVIVDSPDSPDAPSLHRKMRLQGSKAITHRLESEDELDFEKWPFRGTTNVLLPGAWNPTTRARWPEEDGSHAFPWISRGGRIATFAPGNGLTVHHGEPDARWVIERWGTWFQRTRPASWQASIVGARAVLRVLAALNVDAPGAGHVPGILGVRQVLRAVHDAGHELDPEALGIPSPADYLQPVRAMLLARIGKADNVDETISATVAALDIDSLLGEQAIPEKRDRLEGWLCERFAAASLEDKLEIARALCDTDMLEEAMKDRANGGRLESPLSAVLLTSLRTAIVACEEPVGAVDDTIAFNKDALVSRRAVVRRELRMSALLAANYLVGLADLRAYWREEGAGHRLMQPTAETLDRAVITIGKHGPLIRRGYEEAPPEIVSAEALALISYFGRHQEPTYILEGGTMVPPQMVSSVLKESEALRRENERRIKDEKTVRLASTLLAIAGEVALVGFLAFLWWLASMLSDLDLAWKLTFFFAAWLGATPGLFALLAKKRLRPDWARGFLSLIAGGFTGLRSRLHAAATREDELHGRDDAEDSGGKP